LEKIKYIGDLFLLCRRLQKDDCKGENAKMNSRGRYSVRMEGAKYGASFGAALAIAISYTTNRFILGRPFTES
jgi:hypothetical protein